MRLIELIITKLTSGRFIMAVLFSGTACYLAYIKVFPTEAFAGIVTLIVRDYFARTDRENGNGHTNGK